MKDKIVFINFWPKGGMRHYSDAVVNLLARDSDVVYFSNYSSSVSCTNKIFNLSLNLLNPLNYLSLIYIAYSLIKLRPKVVHLNSGYPALLPIFPLFYFFNSNVTVHDAASHDGEKRFKKLFHKIQLFFFSIFFRKIIVHSDKIKAELPEYISRKMVFTVPHVSFDSLSSGKIIETFNRTRDQFTVLFFGRILEYKGLKYLVQAFDFLDEHRYKLVIAGEGLIDFNIRKSNIKIYNRFIEDIEIPKLFNEADVIVTPYISASQSGVVQLSFAYNKPVITTDVGSLTDNVIDKKNGLVVRPGSATSIADAISHISDSSLYNKLVTNIKTQRNIEDILFLKKIHSIYAN